MNESTAINDPATRESSREEAQAAFSRITNIAESQPYWLDDKGYILSMNEELVAAQTYLRDHLDLPTSTQVDGDELQGYEDLTREHAQRILNDLALIWGYPFYRDQISKLAMDMSLCPMHFCDWASCFDDEDEECAAIRSIFPYGHDT